MANVNKLRDTDYSVNRDFPTEISRARKLLWPKLKQIRERNPLSKASLGYPAKIILDGQAVEDMFPEWDSILRGSRIDAAHPSQQNFKSGRSNATQSGNIGYAEDIPANQLSQSLLPQQPRMPPGFSYSPGTGRPTTVQFNVNDSIRSPRTRATGITEESPMEQGDGKFVRPNPASSESHGRPSRSRTRNSEKWSSRSPRSVSARLNSKPKGSKSASRSASRVRGDQSETRKENYVTDTCTDNSKKDAPSDNNDE